MTKMKNIMASKQSGCCTVCTETNGKTGFCVRAANYGLTVGVLHILVTSTNSWREPKA